MEAAADVHIAGVSYAWEDEWAVPPADSLDGNGWAHHGLAVTTDQLIVAGQSGGEEICLLDRGGGLHASWPSGLIEAHGMTLTGAAGAERLWVADPGFAMMPDGSGGYELRRPSRQGRAVCFDLAGRLLAELPVPAGEATGGVLGGYAPTGIAVDEESESLWIADGYGQGLVHRLAVDGRPLVTLSGEEGAGRFDCPHAVFIDRRSARPRLYVTDRGNARLQVFDLEGRYLTAIEEGLRSPTNLVTVGERLIVAELDARLAVLDCEDRLLGYLGSDETAPSRRGWPNEIVADGEKVRPSTLTPGRFNSPHGLAADRDGDIYVAEWLIGGRWIRLRQRSKAIC